MKIYVHLKSSLSGPLHVPHVLEYDYDAVFLKVTQHSPESDVIYTYHYPISDVGSFTVRNESESE